jgi:ABC-2 type transport system permease protein
MSHSLNIPVIKVLIKKDWYLTRKFMALYMGGSIFALSFISLGEWQFVMGATLLMSMVIGMANHLVSLTIINERKEQTLPFVMTLPITPTDYAVAKLIANKSLFFIPWLAILMMTIGVFKFTPIPDGLIPLSVILCSYFLLSYCVVWAVGMIVETEGIVILVMVIMNCLIGPLIYILGSIQDISRYFQSATQVWNKASISVVLLEFFLIIAALAIAFYLQTRKKNFL